MKINVSTIILSLAAASSIYAAPVAPAHLEKRGVVLDKLKELFAKAIKSLECGACVAALVGAKDVAFLNKNWVLDAAEGICAEFKIMPKDVVRPVLVDAVMQASLLSGDGKYICHQVLGACPAQGITSGTLTFPKPKPANAAPPAPNGVLVDVLHLS
ncbi:hypothetical protein BX616_009764, partial [Lobosporangium transversale]